MKTLFPAVLEAAHILGIDSELVSQLKTAVPEVRDFPRTDVHSGSDVIADSYDYAAPIHNSENIGLEPVWPYSLIGDDGPLHNLGVRTFANRPNKQDDDWSFDPIQAARLGLANEVKATMLGLTRKYQAYPSGLAAFMGPEFYVEEIGVLATALQEALVQDYDGIIRIAPAWPAEWQADATVYVRRRSKVDVQVRNGHPTMVVFEAGFSGQVAFRNPWPGQAVHVVGGTSGRETRVTQDSSSLLKIEVKAGESYLIEPSDRSAMQARFVPVGGSPAEKPKVLDSRSIGLGPRQ
jgi:hypothetical protein